MKKLTLILPLTLLVACKIERNQNLAELRVKSDVTSAVCASGKLSDGTYVTKCTIKADDGKVDTLVAAQGGEFPFQAWSYKSTAEIKAERAKTVTPQPAPAAPPAAGSGSGSGSAVKKDK